jgi:transcriptional regulator NrdR family protein
MTMPDRCEKCGGGSKVLSVNRCPEQPLVNRRRECVKCGNRWSTLEAFGVYEESIKEWDLLY